MTYEEIVREVDKDLSVGDPRSSEYRQGAIDLLARKFQGKRFPYPPRYQAGTASYDAYYAGVSERGWPIYNRLIANGR
jgi:hypothetical protein